MKRRLFGVIGHVDHGKTALVRALTGIDTDRLPDEKRRGISIALGFAHLRHGDTEIDLIDMPGHERFVRTMIAGATGLDAVLLVVDAAEGVRPQTTEHVEIAALLGIRRAVVAISKADRADPAPAAQAATALVTRAGIAAEPPIFTSAVTGIGLDALRAALLAAEADPRADDQLPWLPIDRAFSVAGFGTVVTGTLRRGAIAVGEELALLPDGDPIRVRGLQVHGTAVARADPGSRVAVNLRGVEAAALTRGQALARAGALAPTTWLTVHLRALRGAPGLRSGLPVRVLFGTAEVEARLRLLDRDMLEPNEAAAAQLRCLTPVCVPTGEACILRLPAPIGTVAGGRILDTAERRLRRHEPAILRRLLYLHQGDRAAIIAAELTSAGAAGLPIPALARLVGVAESRLQADLPHLGGMAVGGVAVAAEPFRALEARLLGVLETSRVPPATETLATLLRPVASPVLQAALRRLVAAERVRQDGGAWHLVRPDQDRARRSHDGAVAAEIAEALRRGGLSPPAPEALAATRPEARRVLEALRQAGVVVATYDRVQKRQIMFHRDAVEAARRVLMPLLAPPGLLVKEAGAALGISRKYSVPLLEYFDAVQFTRRVGDRRQLLRATDG
ncbi:MAG: selenocysteine-specific translation elongation factor [Rhodospirillales bacterium]|nr:selenocysteine-specific translation elongation factor [Rhodospirillales bacterium]